MANLEEENNNPFADENVQAFTLLTLLQIRDLLGVIAGSGNRAAYEAVRAAHNRGTLQLPPPFLLPQKDVNEPTDSE